MRPTTFPLPYRGSLLGLRTFVRLMPSAGLMCFCRSAPDRPSPYTLIDAVDWCPMIYAMASGLSPDAFRIEPTWWRKLFNVGCFFLLGHRLRHSLRKRSLIAVVVRGHFDIRCAAHSINFRILVLSITRVRSAPRCNSADFLPPMICTSFPLTEIVRISQGRTPIQYARISEAASSRLPPA